MPVDIGLWRVDQGVQRLVARGMPTEERLEDLIEADPSVLGQPLLIIGRQVITSHGKRLDLLALDGDGALHVLELKRERTTREIVAQALDYGSWVRTLTHEDVLEIYTNYRSDKALEVAFDEVFGFPLPEELNTGHALTLVTADLDAESQRIVEYLAEEYAVPINVVFFNYFNDDGREYVARTWLLDQTTEPGGGGPDRTKSPWNGKDWYIAFGDDDERSWDDARRVGFVSAGGGEWYSRTLRSVPEGARVWACIPKTGYVGVGTVTGPAERYPESFLAERDDLVAPYVHPNGEDEWILPVTWQGTRPKSEALWEKGMFANQNSACKLRNAFTLEILYRVFEVAQD